MAPGFLILVADLEREINEGEKREDDGGPRPDLADGDEEDELGQHREAAEIEGPPAKKPEADESQDVGELDSPVDQQRGRRDVALADIIELQAEQPIGGGG